ncbi:MAG: hypothetical protein HN919_12655 [Verrucomicrobia bacterium]|nr:hypothetical protein [Verrucomicrobiota bacterium]
MAEELRVTGAEVPGLRFGVRSNVFTSHNSAESWSLIHVAAVRNHPDIVRMLLAAGSDVNARGLKCSSALELLLLSDSRSFQAVWQSHREYLQMAFLLLKNGARIEDAQAFRRAIGMRSALLVKRLLGAGADPNAVSTASGLTPLLVAVAYKDYEIVGVLLDAGADPYHPDSAGKSVADMAHADDDLRRMLELHRAAREKSSAGPELGTGK